MDIVKKNNLDIVILGGLPEISSFDVIEKIRDYSDAPVMFLSNIDDQPSLIKAFNAGADGYMTKPFQLFEFAARVKALLKGNLKQRV